MEGQSVFHFSFAVDDLSRAREFYVGVLGCPEHTHKSGPAEFEFFGHHIVAHLAPDEVVGAKARTIGNHGTPLRHFGVILAMKDFEAVAEKLAAADVDFIVKPERRFPGEGREQMLMVCRDDCGNAIEFKGLGRVADIFAA